MEYRHSKVPRQNNFAQRARDHISANEPITTLMIRNIPNRYTQKQFVQELVALGFEDMFDFLYLPIDTATEANVGYAFVNFINEATAQHALGVFQQYRFAKYRHVTSKIGTVSVAHMQGYDKNVKHYEKTQVTKNEFHKPVMFPHLRKQGLK